MRFSCLQENLSKALGVVGRAVATRTTLPITNNVLLATDQSRLKLVATNLEMAISCWIGAKVEEEGEITVPARLLTEVVSSLPGEKVDIELSPKKTLGLKCARFEARISGVDAKDFPPIPTVEDGITTTVEVGALRQAQVGELHPEVLASFEITEVACIFEIDLASFLPFTLGHKMFQPIPRFPAMVRDMALVVAAEIAHQRVLDIIRSFPLVEQVTIFDAYSGEQVPRGKKSLAYRITFQSPTHTLTDDEVDKVQQQILDKLSSELGATLRA